jgi:hypothetical protein
MLSLSFIVLCASGGGGDHTLVLLLCWFHCGCWVPPVVGSPASCLCSSSLIGPPGPPVSPPPLVQALRMQGAGRWWGLVRSVVAVHFHLYCSCKTGASSSRVRANCAAAETGCM